MDIFIKILEIVSGSLLTLIGIIVVQNTNLKGKKMDIDAQKSEAENKAVTACQDKHKKDIDNVRTEFRNYLDDLSYKVGELSDKMDEIKTEQIKTILTITQVKESQEKYNNVIARTYKLEQDVAVLQNRESVSEHRIADLESKV